jgi:hypothetical protein
MPDPRHPLTDGTVAVGVVTSYAGDLSVPSKRQALATAGWLVCDGARYLTSAYPDLYTVIKNSHGGDGTIFNVPDLRDRFVRGTNGAATYGAGPVDPDMATRTAAAAGGATGNAVGSLQASATALPRTAWTLAQDGGHAHAFQHLTTDRQEVWGGSGVTMARNPYGTPTTTGAGGHTHTVSGGDATTVPINIAVYWIIKATTA